MKKVNILFGTESGNAEMVADDLEQTLSDAGYETSVYSMEDADLDTCKECDHVVIVTSTYGEGDLPETAAPFYELVNNEKPDFSGLAFSAYGLGDSSYENYNNAVGKFVELLQDLNATLVGEVGKHDAATGGDLTKSATSWIKNIFAA